jgi:hypothetical protein
MPTSSGLPRRAPELGDDIACETSAARPTRAGEDPCTQRGGGVPLTNPVSLGRLAQPALRVQGLGLCDALRVELDPCQIAGAIDEIEARRGPLHEAFQDARARWDAVADWERERGDPTLEHELSSTAYALRILTKLRGQLPTAAHESPVALVGPASTVSEIVAAAARSVVDDLAELIRDSPRSDERAQTRIRDATAAVAAWVQTYLDCESLEWFNFDSDWDPVHQIE